MTASTDRSASRAGGVAALVGIAVLLVATLAHPMGADPSDAPAAFAEYAADAFWVASHLGQLVGVALIAAALGVLSWTLRDGPASTWARAGAVGAAIVLASTMVLQAVDGIALKVLVDRWVAAPPEQQALLFESAFAVRQIEIGLAAIVAIAFGVTALLYGAALLRSAAAASWIGALGVVAGALQVVAGTLYAFHGFAPFAMSASMVASALLMAWGVVGVILLRTGPTTAAGDPSPAA